MSLQQLLSEDIEGAFVYLSVPLLVFDIGLYILGVYMGSFRYLQVPTVGSFMNIN